MSIKKQFLKSKPICKVSFKVSSEEVNGADTVQILGDFNNWDKSVEPMKKLKSGAFSQTIELASDAEYEIRYFVDGETWANETEADSTVANAFGEMNDVISTAK